AEGRHGQRSTGVRRGCGERTSELASSGPPCQPSSGHHRTGGLHMDVLERIDAAIAERDLLTHPFYTKWVAGTLPRECLQEYARQYHAFESSFPTFLSAIHSRTEDRGVRQALLENLWDEEHGEAN